MTKLVMVGAPVVDRRPPHPGPTHLPGPLGLGTDPNGRVHSNARTAPRAQASVSLA